jgi:hypothetical protein
MGVANRTSTGGSVSPALVAAVIAVVVVLIGFIAWKTVGGGSSDSDRVKIDPNTLKQQIQQNGIGHH